jgi:thiamine biosynthesis lipoprotein
MLSVALACHAMATRFEIVLHGDNSKALRAAGEEAIREIERLEDQLSLYRPSSEIAHLNARAAREPVQVTPSLLALLQHARRLNQESDGAFDITIAPLVHCWGFMHGNGRLPRDEELAEARAKVGMHLVELDSVHRTVHFAREGVMLDLGAIGKGYAIERAADLLRENGVSSALLHGGTSSIYALGHPPEAEFWSVSVENPQELATRELPPKVLPLPLRGGEGQGERAVHGQRPVIVRLRDKSFSVSAIRAKSFEVNGQSFGHVLDPRTGAPASGAILAAVVLPSATETDALSTALLTLGAEGRSTLLRAHPDIRTLLVWVSGGKLRIENRL